MIDWDRVRELVNEVGEEDFEEIVLLFLDEVTEVAEKLRSAPVMAELAGDLHFLKGCSLNLGFRALSTLCQAGETAAAGGSPETVDIGEILSVFDNSRAEFEKNASSKIAA